MSQPNLPAAMSTPDTAVTPHDAPTVVARFDDVPDANAGVAWHQEQFCEHAEMASDLSAAGRDLLAGQHRRMADWHRGQAAELASP